MRVGVKERVNFEESYRKFLLFNLNEFLGKKDEGKS